jgi:4-hydroxy-2-oxoheptanedioate aldolase
VLVAVQIETAEGLANADAIAATEGVDVVFVGPGDLSVSLGTIRPEHAERLAGAIESIIVAALAKGKAAGIFCARPEDVAKWSAKGASFFMLASDTMFLGAAAAESFRAARSELAEGNRK